MLKETVIVPFKVPEITTKLMTLLKLFSSKYPHEAQKGFCQASLGSGRISERNSET